MLATGHGYKTISSSGRNVLIYVQYYITMDIKNILQNISPKKKKLLLILGGFLLFLILVLIVVLAVGGSSEGDGTPDGPNSDGDGDDVVTGSVTLDYWGLWEPESVMEPTIQLNTWIIIIIIDVHVVQRTHKTIRIMPWQSTKLRYLDYLWNTQRNRTKS